MTNRIDKGIGFPDGIIDIGEDKVTSAKREFKEEVGLDINIDDNDYISTFKCGNIVAHQYLKKVDFDYLVECIKHQHLAKDFLTENTGLMILRFDNLTQMIII
jgi:8-oxo-dGTP pyrophosphatase MutT (NUDIX family)